MSDPSNSPINVLVVGMGQVGQAILDVLITPHYKRRVHSFLLVPRILQLDQPSQQLVEQYRTHLVQLLEGEITSAAIEYFSDLFRQHKIDTVVSCLGAQQTETQHALIDAARHGGVNHFIPSDFGADWEVMSDDDPLYDITGRSRRAVHAAAKESGMDWTFIACGAFAEHLLTSDDFGVDPPKRTIRVPQPLDRRLTYTALPDVGQLTAMAICDSSTRNKALRIGRVTTTQHVIDTLNKHKPDEREWTVEQLSDEQLHEMADSDTKLLFPRMALSTVKGTHVMQWEEAQTWKNGEYEYMSLETVRENIAGALVDQEAQKEADHEEDKK